MNNAGPCSSLTDVPTHALWSGTASSHAHSSCEADTNHQESSQPHVSSHWRGTDRSKHRFCCMAHPDMQLQTPRVSVQSMLLFPGLLFTHSLAVLWFPVRTCRKKTLRLEPHPGDPNQLLLSFSFSATAPCRWEQGLVPTAAAAKRSRVAWTVTPGTSWGLDAAAASQLLLHAIVGT